MPTARSVPTRRRESRLVLPFSQRRLEQSHVHWVLYQNDTSGTPIRGNELSVLETGDVRGGYANDVVSFGTTNLLATVQWWQCTVRVDVWRFRKVSDEIGKHLRGRSFPDTLYMIVILDTMAIRKLFLSIHKSETVVVTLKIPVFHNVQ